jgi:hypothetical protein
MARNKGLSSETCQFILVLRNEEQRKLALTRIDSGVGGPGAQLSKRTSTLVSSLRNRRLTSPQLAASLNSTRKTPVTTSTVKRRLRDAGLTEDELLDAVKAVMSGKTGLDGIPVEVYLTFF